MRLSVRGQLERLRRDLDQWQPAPRITPWDALAGAVPPEEVPPEASAELAAVAGGTPGGPLSPGLIARLRDPLVFARTLWPAVSFYDKQVEILHSLVENDETFVPAGNMLGKDFVAGFAALWFFLTRREVRVVTTSVKDDHLRVLWGEVGRFIDTSRVPLLRKDGGPLVVNHRDVRKVVGGAVCKISYLLGMVSEKGEGMAGHHAAHTLLIIDEASGVDDIVYTQGDTWAQRKLVIGNPLPCANFFYRGVKGGNVVATR